MSLGDPADRVELREEDVEAVADTLRSGWLTMGPRIQAFEAAFAGRPRRAARGRRLQRHRRAAPRLRGARTSARATR